MRIKKENNPLAITTSTVHLLLAIFAHSPSFDWQHTQMN